MNFKATTLGVGSALLVLGLTGTGCATKKHVAKVVAPVEQRVSEAEKKASEQQAAIGELNNNVSRADERAQDADRKAVAAGQAADQARGTAEQAQGAARQAAERADAAQQLAERGMNEVDRLAGNLDNYKMVGEHKVHFGFDKHALTKEHKEQLDQLVQNLGVSKNFVIEVQGFTDRTGGSEYNVNLARKRAEAVVRYLTVQHNVPLRRISVLGVGEAPDVEENTRAARKDSRRVDVRIFALDLKGGMPAQQQSNLQSSNTPSSNQ